jgi:4-hydroxy-tetrahydrodipicolinate synthase
MTDADRNIDFHGIIPAMVTPMKADESLDEEALQAHVDRLIEAGVQALFSTGSQGEFYALSIQEKERVWQIVVEQTEGRIPVIAGTGAVTTQEVELLNHIAAQCGVDAVSVVSPFFITLTQDELHYHYMHVADRSELPIFLYNNPGRTHVVIEPALVARLAEHPRIVGIKDSSGDLTQTMELIRRTDSNFCVLMGRDSLILAGLHCGTRGAIAATANVVPDLVLEIYRCYVAGNIQRAQEAQNQLLPLRIAFGLGTFPVVVKSALEMIGLGAGPARSPVRGLGEAQQQALRKVLQEMKIL